MSKFLILITILFFFLNPKTAWADVTVVSPSAQLVRPKKDINNDLRPMRLEQFLNKHKSPLADYSEDFVNYADKYNLDWRLVPAISGVESTFAKRYPYGTFNAYGWANGKYKFSSWENSIEVVSRTLREKYYDKGATNINKIARRYAPPSNSWSWKVKFFMDKIDPTPVEFDL